MEKCPEHALPFKDFGTMGESMLKNVHSIIVLVHVDAKSTYPYALLKRFRTSRHPMVSSIDKSELYNILNSLEHKGYVRSRTVRAGGKLQRVYVVTLKGGVLAKKFRRTFFRFASKMSSMMRGAFAE